MRVIEINAIYGSMSTGTIVKNIQDACTENDIDCYVAYSECYLDSSQVVHGYKIGNIFDYKLHAILNRISGKMAYFSHIPTYFFLRYIDKLKPDVVHLHNLHGNYINLIMLLKYLAKNDIATVITMHDCWYFTGGCSHYTSVNCYRWQEFCGKCPRRYMEIPAYIYDGSTSILQDRVKLLSSIPRLTMVGCSKWISEECRKSKIKCKNITHIYNGFNLDIFKPIIEENKIISLKKYFNIPLNKKIILLPASKWYEDMNKQALYYFEKEMPDNIVMVIFGCPNIRKKTSANVIEIGYLKSPSDIAALYNLGDVLVNCSRQDTLSSINIECQACGTPVVAYDNTGTTETVHPNLGRLVNTGNVEMLFKKTMEVLSINNRAELLVKWVTENFEKDLNYQKYINLYRSIYNK